MWNRYHYLLFIIIVVCNNTNNYFCNYIFIFINIIIISLGVVKIPNLFHHGWLMRKLGVIFDQVGRKNKKTRYYSANAIVILKGNNSRKLWQYRWLSFCLSKAGLQAAAGYLLLCLHASWTPSSRIKNWRKFIQSSVTTKTYSFCCKHIFPIFSPLLFRSHSLTTFSVYLSHSFCHIDERRRRRGIILGIKPSSVPLAIKLPSLSDRCSFASMIIICHLR